MQIQINIDITIVLIAFYNSYELSLLFMKKTKSANHPLATGLALQPNSEWPPYLVVFSVFVL